MVRLISEKEGLATHSLILKVTLNTYGYICHEFYAVFLLLYSTLSIYLYSQERQGIGVIQSKGVVVSFCLFLFRQIKALVTCLCL